MPYKKKLFVYGLSISMIIFTFPLLAEAITGIQKTEIDSNGDEIRKLRFLLESKVPTTPFGGYALFTEEGDVIAITSHAGFFDSTGQQAPTSSQVANQVGAIAAVCNISDDACGNEWHTHLVKPVVSDLCDFAAIGELTYNQPTDRLDISGKNIIARGIDIGVEGFVGALGGTLMDFTVGTPGASAAFDLDPVDANGDTITDPADLAAVCIVPTP